MDDTDNSGAYGDTLYEYDYAAWNDVSADGSHGHQPEAEQSPSAVSNLPGHPPYHDTHPSSDDNDHEEIGLEFLRNQELSEEELRELCEIPLQLNKPTQMEVDANIDPLCGRVYKQDRPVAERPGDFIAAMAAIRRQLAMLSQTELFDSIPRFPDSTNYSNPIPARGGGGVQGPSVTDAVDVDKLLAEMGGSPP